MSSIARHVSGIVRLFLQVRDHVAGICAPPLFLLLLLPLMVVLSGCRKADSVPTDSGEQHWTVSGKTYIVGSKDPISGVVVKCAGVSTTSGPDGGFELRGIPAGSQTLTAEKPGTESYSASIDVTADITYYVFIEVKTGTLSGYVTNVIDGPVKGAKVTFGSLFDYTDLSGRYEFHLAHQKTDSFSVIHPDYSGYAASISLHTPDTAFDVILRRETTIAGEALATYYLDQANPSRVMPSFPDNQVLHLRANGYDNLGIFRDGIEQDILVGFTFPQLLLDNRVTLLDGSLQLCLDGPYTQFGIQTYAVTSSTGFAQSYSLRPSLGQVVYSGLIGDGFSGGYWKVLGVDGLTTMLATFRNTRINNGVEIKGGTTTSVGFYSSYSSTNRPKILFRVRY